MSKITREDISNAIEKWRADNYQNAKVLSAPLYEYYKENEPERISEEGREGDDEYIILDGQKFYKSKLILNPYKNFKDIKDLIK